MSEQQASFGKPGEARVLAELVSGSAGVKSRVVLTKRSLTKGCSEVPTQQAKQTNDEWELKQHFRI